MHIPSDLTGDEWWLHLWFQGSHLNGTLCEPVVLMIFHVVCSEYHRTMVEALGD